jgi:four helix bundle protein
MGRGNTIVHSYKDLIVWQRAIQLVVAVYEVTEKFPKEEIYGLVSQMRRAAISIPSNIAEGRLRGHRREFCQFLLMAFGSGGELETQVEIAKHLSKTMFFDYTKVQELLTEVMKIPNAIINKLRIS